MSINLIDSSPFLVEMSILFSHLEVFSIAITAGETLYSDWSGLYSFLFVLVIHGLS